MKHRHKEYKFKNEDIVCQIINGSIDPYANFHMKIVMERKGEKEDVVLDVLQDMGNELLTSAQGKIG